MRNLIDMISEASTATYTLYHGTCSDALTKTGWTPGSGPQGGNMGQTRYLYLTSGAEDAMWFAEEKGCSTVLVVRDVPAEYLIVDPEDGIGDTVEDELNSPHGFPGKVALTRFLGPEHFSVHNGINEVYTLPAHHMKDEQWNRFQDEYEVQHAKLKQVGQLPTGQTIWSEAWPMPSGGGELFVKSADELVCYFALTGAWRDDTFTVNLVFTRPDQRQQALAYMLYSWVLAEGFNLVSDVEQTKGSQAIWIKLFRDGRKMFIHEDGEKITPLTDVAAFYAQPHNDQRLMVLARG